MIPEPLALTRLKQEMIKTNPKRNPMDDLRRVMRHENPKQFRENYNIGRGAWRAMRNWFNANQ